MKTLPPEFIGNRDQGKVGTLPAYHFKMLNRLGMCCLFEKSRGGKGTKFYEVVILRSEPDKTFPNGFCTPAHESMPSPEEWGTSGWSYYDLAPALDKFESLSNSSRVVKSGVAHLLKDQPDGDSKQI